jgi:hypothetical protein
MWVQSICDKIRIMSDKKNPPRITEFRPQAKNPNKHNTFGMRLLEKSIQSDGWIGAQTSAADGEIIAGSARQEIAVEKFTDENGQDVEPIVIESDGTRPVIIKRIDIPSADSARARRLSAAENQIAKANYNPDFDLLKEWAGEDEQIKKLFSDDEWREGTKDEMPQFKEYGEDIADGIQICKCPTCGHEHAAKKN